MADVYGGELASGSPLAAVLDNLRAVNIEQTRREVARFAGAVVLVPVIADEVRPDSSNEADQILGAAEQVEGSRFLPTTTQIVVSGFERIGFGSRRRKKEIQAAIKLRQTALLYAERSDQYISLHMRLTTLKRRYPYVGNLAPYLQEKEAKIQDSLPLRDQPHFCHMFYVQQDSVPLFGVSPEIADSPALMLTAVHVIDGRLTPLWTPLLTSPES